MALLGMTYDEAADEAMKLGAKPMEGDSNAITARIVEKLKVEQGWKEGEPEEQLWGEARDLYWRWCDSRWEKKKKSGEEEYLDTAVEL